MSRAATALLRAAGISLIALAIGPASDALAEPPSLSLESPAAGSVSGDRTPSFSGSTNDFSDEVIVNVYAGSAVEGGAQVETLSSPMPAGGSWSTGPTEPLPDGVYTAQASQTMDMETGVSEPPVTFRVDTSSPTVTLQQPASPSSNTAPSFAGFASDTTPVTVKIYAGASASGGVVATATANLTGGEWTSEAASPSLTAGQYTAVATQESSLGNPPGSSAPVTFVVETAAPRVTLERPRSPSNNTTPSFTGTASDTTSVLVQIYAGGSASGPVVAHAAATGNGGTWTSGNASPALASGQYTAVAEQESSLGNPTGTSSPVTFTVQTASPSVTLSQPTALSNNTKPTFSGTAGDTTSVVVHIFNAASSEVASASSSGGGSWTASNESSLASGSYTAVATQESSLGNPPGMSERRSFTIETTAPRVTLSSPAVRSNNQKPSFSGTASDITTVTVHIYAGSTASGSVVSTATAGGTGGAWSSSSASPELPNGQYTATATQPSSLGNPPGTSAPVTFNVDTTSPTVALNQPPSPSNNTKPTFTGTASDTPSITVRVYAGATAKGSPVAEAVAPGTGGSWSSSSASPALVSGQYTATATQPSSLGNPAGVSAPVTFTVNTSAPTVTLVQPKSPSNVVTPTFSGTASDTTPVVVHIYNASSVEVASAFSIGGGNWTSGNASPALASGTYKATATQSSSLGNPTGQSAPVTFVVSTASPTVTLTAPPSPSNNTKPTLAGTASDSTPVVVHIDEATTGLEVAKVSTTPKSGTWSITSPSLATGKHTYTASATQSSSLGNPEGSSGAVSFVVDTTPPTVTLNPLVAHSNNATPTFSGTASDTSAVVVQIYAGTAAKGTVLRTVTATGTGAAWASGAVSPALPSGKHTYTAIATQNSSLGNPPGTSAPQTFSVDTAAPSVTLNTPPPRIGSSTPSFTGTASETSDVVVEIYSGATVKGDPASTATAKGTGAAWASAAASPALPDGQYVAVASQDSLFGHEPGETAPVSFTVDTAPPQVTLTYPSGGSSTGNSSQLVGGSAGIAAGDLAGVTAQLFSGSEVGGGQAPMQSIQVTATEGAWSTTFAGLSPGTYTVRAEQSDEAGNLGISAASTFSVSSPTGSSPASTPAPPVASFSWSPSAPHVGQVISLLSSSTDAVSPISGFAWDLAGTGAFAAGGSLNSTSFATPGKHLVQLRVTDANGLSSVAAQEIEVTPAPLPLMEPFPIVRITATRTGSRVKLKLLSVRALAGAHITIKCTGHGCPVKSQSKVAAAGKVGAAPIEFRSFERSLRAGVVLEIRISKAGEIGKYTRFAVRRGKLPVRTDACLGPAGGNPMACPVS